MMVYHEYRSFLAIFFLTFILISCSRVEQRGNGETARSHPSLFMPSEEALTYSCEYTGKQSIPLDKPNVELWRGKPEIVFNSDAATGAPDGPMTYVRFAWTEEMLLFYVEVEDSFCGPEYVVHKNVWEGNNIEFLIAPRWYSEPYQDEYEFLFNCLKGYADLHWVDGAGLDASLLWDAEEIEYRTYDYLSFHSESSGWALQGRIPFRVFDMDTPRNNEQWGLGIFRCHFNQDMSGRLYLAWSPPLTDPPRFHTPQKFGILHFKRL